MARADTYAAAARARDAEGIVHVAREAVDPAAPRLLRLRQAPGLRSAVNTALRARTPTSTGATVQGVFHPPCRALAQQAATALAPVTLRAAPDIAEAVAIAADLWRDRRGAALARG
jgi:anthranilate phosphoribosyltransferase